MIGSKPRVLASALAVGVALFVLIAAVESRRTCGSHDLLSKEIAANPRRGEKLAEIEQNTARYIQSKTTSALNDIVYIPVVFHVLYTKANAPEFNVSDDLIIDQLQQLNDDMANVNVDYYNTPAEFASVAADLRIQFCLAKRTPDNLPSTGINRKQTSVTRFSSSGEPIKFNSTGGMSAWPTDKYLNIWMADIQDGLLGYATFPGGNVTTDGVVVAGNSVGSIASPSDFYPYDFGRTLTHEVGHWLNLRHIWGDATCGDDLVADTPTAFESNYGCPTFPKQNTCSENDHPNGEMFMNFMDYVDDACMNMFTEGQAARAYALLRSGGSRFSLTTSNGCVPVGPTLMPTSLPTMPPTRSPTPSPTPATPTGFPTPLPSFPPSLAPTGKPVVTPTNRPTAPPTGKPSSRPTSKPTVRPTRFPTAKPTARPTKMPATRPTRPPVD